MPRIAAKLPATSAPVSTRAPARTAAKVAAPKAQEAKAGWGAKAATLAAAPRAKTALPNTAPGATDFVKAYAAAAKGGESMVAMVEGSFGTNQAADAMLRRTASELASQLADRGQDQKADAVTASLEKFLKDVGPAQHYHLDPDRGTMGALEDNGDRMTKVMAKLKDLAGQLAKVNAEPSGENQQAYNRSAFGDSVMNEALFACAFTAAYDKGGDPKVVKDATAFLAKLPKQVDSQIESRGGSMEPLERAGATSTALQAYARRLEG